jgi:hypothetical protein
MKIAHFSSPSKLVDPQRFLSKRHVHRKNGKYDYNRFSFSVQLFQSLLLKNQFSAKRTRKCLFLPVIPDDFQKQDLPFRRKFSLLIIFFQQRFHSG